MIMVQMKKVFSLGFPTQKKHFKNTESGGVLWLLLSLMWYTGKL